MVVAMQISGLSGKVCVPARPSASFAGRRVAAPTNGCKVFAKKEGNWLPGADTPSYLDELPAYVSGPPCIVASNPIPARAVVLNANNITHKQSICRSYGFDPLGFSSSVDLRDRFQESELIHSRWAMAGVAGVLAVELLGQGNWVTAQQWVQNFCSSHIIAGTALRHNLLLMQ